MEQDSVKANRLAISMLSFMHDSQDHSSHVFTYLAEDKLGEKPEWYFFAVAQVFSRATQVKPILESLIKRSHRLFSEKVSISNEIDTEFVFDEVLLTINSEWKKRVKKYLHDAMRESTIVMGVIMGNKMCVADRGVCLGLMVSPDKSNVPRLVPIITPDINKQNEDHENLFTSVICGGLKNNSRIIIGTPRIQKVGRNEVFLQLLSKRTTTLNDIASRVKKKINSTRKKDYAGLLIEVNDKSNLHVARTIFSGGPSLRSYLHDPPESHTAIPRAAHKGLVIAMDSISRAGKLSSKSGGKILKRIKKQTPAWMKLPKGIKKYVEKTNRVFNAMYKPVHSLYKYIKLNTLTKNITRGIKSIFFKSARVLLLTLLWIATNIGRPISFISKRLWRWFRSLKFSRQAALSSAVIIILLFVVGLSMRGRMETKRVQAANTQQLVDTFNAKKTAAESRLIFNDTKGARRALREAQDVLARLPQDSEETLSLTKNLAQRLAPIMIDIRKETLVKDLHLVYEHEPRENSSTYTSISSDTELTWQTPASHMRVITSNQTISLPSILAEDNTFVSNEETIMYLNQGSLVVVNTDKLTTETRAVINHADGLATHSLYPYSKRLYTLDAGGMIWKHPPSASGYARPTKWLSSTVSMINPTNMIIDGNVWVLDNGKTIHKFFKGKTEDFNHDSIEPILENATHIWTITDSDYLYILEPSNQRIIVVTKKGQLVTQYIFDGPEPNHFAIDEKSKRGFITQENLVLSFALTHLTN